MSKRTQVGQLSLLDSPKKERVGHVQNSGFVGNEDYALMMETNANGYDLDKPARVYCVTEGMRVQNLWVVSTRDAMRICSHARSKGKLYGSEWIYCWTQHDVGGEAMSRYVDKFKDDGRLAKFEGLEDVKVLRSFT